MFETKVLPLLQAKIDGDGPGSFSGYASVFGGVDSYGDRIMPGAYKATIPKFLKDGFVPWGHDWAGYPVATPLNAREDAKGLWIEAQFHTDAESQRARQIVSERLERGKSMGLSIGYAAKAFDFVEEEGRPIRRLTEIDLMEVSLVPVPADDAARVASVKTALKRGLNRAQMDRVLAIFLEALAADEDAVEALAEATSDDGKAAPGAGDGSGYAAPAAVMTSHEAGGMAAVTPDATGDGTAADAPASKGDAPAGETGAAPPPGLALAGAATLAALEVWTGHLKGASDEEVLAARDELPALLRRLGSARLAIDLLMKRAEVLADTTPRELYAQFQRFDGLYGHNTSRRAG